ncbi:MAG: hypothetical protein ACOCP8_03470 [archaeon]
MKLLFYVLIFFNINKLQIYLIKINDFFINNFEKLSDKFPKLDITFQLLLINIITIIGKYTPDVYGNYGYLTIFLIFYINFYFVIKCLENWNIFERVVNYFLINIFTIFFFLIYQY